MDANDASTSTPTTILMDHLKLNFLRQWSNNTHWLQNLMTCFIDAWHRFGASKGDFFRSRDKEGKLYEVFESIRSEFEHMKNVQIRLDYIVRSLRSSLRTVRTTLFHLIPTPFFNRSQEKLKMSLLAERATIRTDEHSEQAY